MNPVYMRLAVAIIFSPAIYLFFLLLTRATSQDGMVVAFTILLPLSLVSVVFMGLSVKKFMSISKTHSKAAVSPKRIIHTLVVSAVVLLCLFLSATKGWSSFILFPTAFIAVLLYQRMQLSTDAYTKATVAIGSKSNDTTVLSLRILQTVAILGFYITTVGFDDTNNTVALGFITSQADSPLTMVSTGLSILCAVAFILTTAWIYKIIIRNRRTT